MNDLDRALDKINKCLALSKSPEPHEAAAALRQAKALMKKYGITDSDIELSAVKESEASLGRSLITPPRWMALLADTVSIAFGVAQFFRPSRYSSGSYIFIGVELSSEVSQYCFIVLKRQCALARQNYYKSIRGKRANRIRRADAHALGWVIGVRLKVEEFASEIPGIVGQYLSERHSQLVTFKPIDRSKKCDAKDSLAGFIEGSNVDIHHGVSDVEKRRLKHA